MRRFVAAALLLLVTVTVYLAVQRSSRPKAEDDIREAVFRYQMHHYKSDVYFLAINNRDPSNNFMARFKGCKRPVRKRSESKFESAGPSTRDKKTGAKGVILESWDLKWLNNSVEVYGAEMWIPRCGSGFKFSVALKDRRWVVTDAKWVAIY